MSSDEMLKYEGYLAVNLRDRADTQLRIQGMITTLRNKLDSMVPVEKLEGELIMTLGMEIATLQLKYKALLASGATLHNLLNR